MSYAQILLKIETPSSNNKIYDIYIVDTHQLIFFYIASANILLTCCPTIRLSGAQRSELNQLYTRTNRIVNGRPSYIDDNNNYGMWWDGEAGSAGDWMIGDYSNIDENKLTYGFLANDQDTPCPIDSERWKEYYNSEWAINWDAFVFCDRTYNIELNCSIRQQMLV